MMFLEIKCTTRGSSLFKIIHIHLLDYQANTSKVFPENPRNELG